MNASVKSVSSGPSSTTAIPSTHKRKRQDAFELDEDEMKNSPDNHHSTSAPSHITSPTPIDRDGEDNSYVPTAACQQPRHQPSPPSALNSPTTDTFSPPAHILQPISSPGPSIVIHAAGASSGIVVQSMNPTPMDIDPTSIITASQPVAPFLTIEPTSSSPPRQELMEKDITSVDRRLLEDENSKLKQSKPSLFAQFVKSYQELAKKTKEVTIQLNNETIQLSTQFHELQAQMSDLKANCTVAQPLVTLMTQQELEAKKATLTRCKEVHRIEVEQIQLQLMTQADQMAKLCQKKQALLKKHQELLNQSLGEIQTSTSTIHRIELENIYEKKQLELELQRLKDELDKQLMSQSTKLQKLKSTITSLEWKNHDLTNEKKNAELELNPLKAKHHQLVIDHRKLEARVYELTEDQATLRPENERLVAAHQLQMEQMNHQSLGQLSSQTSEMAMANQAKQTWSDENHRQLQQTNQQLGKDVQILQAANARLFNTKQELIKEKKEWKIELNRLSKEKNQSSLRQLLSKLSELESNQTVATATIASLTETNHELEGKMAQLLESHRLQDQHLRSQLSTQTDHITTLCQEQQSLLNDYQHLKDTSSADAHVLRSTIKRIVLERIEEKKEWTQRFDQFNQEKTQLLTTCHQLESTVAELESSRTVDRAIMAKLVETNQRATDDIERLQNQLFSSDHSQPVTASWSTV